MQAVDRQPSTGDSRPGWPAVCLGLLGKLPTHVHVLQARGRVL